MIDETSDRRIYETLYYEQDVLLTRFQRVLKHKRACALGRMAVGNRSLTWFWETTDNASYMDWLVLTAMPGSKWDKKVQALGDGDPKGFRAALGQQGLRELCEAWNKIAVKAGIL